MNAERDGTIFFSYYNCMLVLPRPHIHPFVTDFPGEDNINFELLPVVIQEIFYK